MNLRPIFSLVSLGNGSCFAGLLLFSLSIVATPVSAQDLSLDLSTRLRYDDATEGSDWDSTFYSNLTLTDLIKNRLDLKLSGWGLWDIDANDAFDRALDRKNIRVSEGYIDLRNLGSLSRLRLGRQYLRETDWLHLDGASALFRENKPVSFFLFGGRQVSYYRSAHDDWAGGGGVVWRPTWRTRHQFDAYAAHEADAYFLAYAWRWNQYWGRQWRTTSRLRFLNSEMRDYRFHLSKYIQSFALGMDADYYFQPERRGHDAEARARSFSTFGQILGPRAANHRISLSFNRFIGETWMIQAGGTLRRRLDAPSDIAYNSLDSESVHLSLTRFNAFLKNLDITLSGEYIRNEQDSLWTLTGQASYRIAKRWDFSAGVSYARYRFDPIDFNTDYHRQEDLDLLIEELRMPVYFAEARWRPNKTFDLRAEVSYQDMDQLHGGGFGARLTLNYHLRHSFKPAGEDGGWGADSSANNHKEAAP